MGPRPKVLFLEDVLWLVISELCGESHVGIVGERQPDRGAAQIAQPDAVAQGYLHFFPPALIRADEHPIRVFRQVIVSRGKPVRAAEHRGGRKESKNASGSKHDVCFFKQLLCLSEGDPFQAGG